MQRILLLKRPFISTLFLVVFAMGVQPAHAGAPASPLVVDLTAGDNELWDIAVLPDGTAILVGFSGDAPNRQGQVFTVTSDGDSDLGLLEPLLEGTESFGFSISPDGNWIGGGSSDVPTIWLRSDLANPMEAGFEPMAFGGDASGFVSGITNNRTSSVNGPAGDTAYVWSPTIGLQQLPFLQPLANFAQAWGISDDATILPGTTAPALVNSTRAVFWAGGDVAVLEGSVGESDVAFSVSPNGRVIGGGLDGAAALWIDGALLPILDANNLPQAGYVYDVTDDGLAVGGNNFGFALSEANLAFIAVDGRAIPFRIFFQQETNENIEPASTVLGVEVDDNNVAHFAVNGDARYVRVPLGQAPTTPTPTPTPSPTPTPEPTPGTLIDADFALGNGQALGWTGGAVDGFGGSAALETNGLCMTVPGPGLNQVLWVSPENYVELMPNTVYRARVSATTTQDTPGSIPPFFVAYDNFQTNGLGNNFGGYFWFLDVDGGANALGRPNGREFYDAWIAPITVGTPQWTALAFSPTADLVNDFRLQFRVIDSAPLLFTDADSGTICVQQLQVTTFDRASLQTAETVFNPPISTDSYFVVAETDIGGGTAVIDDDANVARFDLSVLGDVRKTIGPFVSNAPSTTLQLFPVVWQPDELYRVRSSIEAAAPLDDPVDVIFLGADTATLELGTAQYVTRGAIGGPMQFAGSPRLEPATYEAYFYSHNATDSITPDAGHLRPLAFFFNTNEIAGIGTGSDPFVVSTLEVDRMIVPGETGQ